MFQYPSTIFMKPELLADVERGKPLSLPVISGLAICTDVIGEVAKLEFLSRNPKRKKVPAKFTKSYCVRLDYIEDAGVMVPILLRDVQRNGEINPFFEEYLKKHCVVDEYSKSRDLVMESIVCANKDIQIPKNVPMSCISKLQKMGTRLLGKSVAFGVPEKTDKVVYSPYTKKSIRRMSRAIEKEMLDVQGTICAFDRKSRSFNLLTSDGLIIPAKYRMEHEPIIRKVFDDFIESKILVKGICRKNIYNSILGIDNIHSVEPMKDLRASPNIEERLAEIQVLENGWLDGVGVRIPAQNCNTVMHVLKELKQDFSIPFPFLYPTTEGGIQAEWSEPPWDITLLFDFETNNAEFFAIHSGTQDIREYDVEFGKRELRYAVDEIAQLFNMVIFEVL